MDEFDAIAQYFAPLTGGAAGAYGLNDDAAFLRAPDSAGFVVTTDTIVENVHFLSNDPIDSIARKLLRVNVSDLIAKGAKPLFAFLNLSWPIDRPADQLAEFARGLGEDLAALGPIALMGGDTTSIDGPLVASLTLVGEPYGKKPVLRRGASPGDFVFVTGTIGNGFLGLAQLRGELPKIIDPMLGDAYRGPEVPHPQFGAIVAQFGRASLDISDGLIGDLGKMAVASGLEISLDLDRVPFAPKVQAWRNGHHDPDAVDVALCNGGDDYQTALIIKPTDTPMMEKAAKALGVQITRVGVCRAGLGVKLYRGIKPFVFDGEMAGHRHQLGGAAQ